MQVSFATVCSTKIVATPETHCVAAGILPACAGCRNRRRAGETPALPRSTERNLRSDLRLASQASDFSPLARQPCRHPCRLRPQSRCCFRSCLPSAAKWRDVGGVVHFCERFVFSRQARICKSLLHASVRCIRFIRDYCVCGLARSGNSCDPRAVTRDGSERHRCRRPAISRSARAGLSFAFGEARRGVRHCSAGQHCNFQIRGTSPSRLPGPSALSYGICGTGRYEPWWTHAAFGRSW